MTVSTWYRPSPKLDTADELLFCLPFAGAGIGAYRAWDQSFPDSTAVLPIELPGRERRIKESPYQRMDTLVEDLWTALSPLMSRPWSVFGHSMGAAVAHALCQRAVREGHAPELLILSARRAPNEPPAHPPLFELPDEELITAVESLYGPFPEVLRRHPALLRSFLPTLRADLEVLDTYTPSITPRLDCPIVALLGEDDHVIPPKTMEGWREVTESSFELITLPGGHFMVRDRQEAREQVLSQFV